MTRPKPLVLPILDGWGYRAETKGNAIALARKPNYDRLLREFSQHAGSHLWPLRRFARRTNGQQRSRPHEHRRRPRRAHGHHANRPGHRRRLIFQESELLLRAMQTRAEAVTFSTCSDCSATAACIPHHAHLLALLRMAKQNDVERVFVHCFHGRPRHVAHSGVDYPGQLQQQIRETSGRSLRSPAATTPWTATTAGNA